MAACAAVHCHVGAAVAAVLLSHALTLALFGWLIATVPSRHHVPWSERMLAHFSLHAAGNVIAVTYGVFSLASCVLFVFETYLDHELDEFYAEPLWLVLTDVSLQPIFVWNYVLFFVLYRRKLSYIFSMSAIVDVETIIPVYADFGMLTRLTAFANEMWMKDAWSTNSYACPVR